MTDIRPCTADDIGGVTDLFMRVFRRTAAPASPELRSYFADLYLGSPWASPERPSLVAVDGTAVTGFLGAMPMPLRLEGRDLVGTVGGNFMVDPDRGGPFVAPRLLRTFLGAEQDLAFTDTANPVAMQFWTRLGGRNARFPSMSWVLPIRAAGAGVAIATRSKPKVASVAYPATRLVDRFLRRRLGPPRGAGSAVLTEVSDATFYDVVEDFGDTGQLHLCATRSEFEWLLAMMRKKRAHGPFQLLTLHIGGSAARGAVIFFPNPRRIAQLAYVAAAPGDAGALVSALRRHAFDAGSAAIMGQADPRLSVELSELPVAYMYRNDFVVMHSRKADLLDPLVAGEIAMSRITGEWWTRMQGDRF